MNEEGTDKGIGDYIQIHGIDAFRQNVLRRAEPVANWLERVNEQLKADGINADDELPPKTTKLEAQYTQVKLVVGDKIKFNELTKEIEFNGVLADYDSFALELAVQFKLELKGITEKNFKAVIVKIAKENAYHPVRDYFNNCSEKHPDTSILDNLAKHCFGTNNLLYQTFVRKWLIATVARVYEPGCKVDTALILQGEQGLGKSTFFKVLASDKWFCDDMGSPDSKDELLKLHQSLTTEWAELENIFSKSDISKVKGFLSTSTDKIRMPYGAKTESMPRMGTIVGTTNKMDALRDPTGSRRFWFIPVSKKIPTDWLKENRDAIWGAAVQAYKNGETWYLNQDEQKSSDSNNQAFSTVSPWLDDIENYIEGKISVTTDELLNQMGVDKENLSQVKRAQSEISDIMSQLKWVKTENLKDDTGKRKRGYKRSVAPIVEPSVTESLGLTQPPIDRVNDCVSQNLYVEEDTQPTQLTQPHDEKLKKNKPEPIHTEFKVGDKVKQSKNWVPIGGNPWYGDVIEVIKPNVDGDRETYKVRWRKPEAPLVQQKYGYEIEIDTRKFRTSEDPLP